VRLTIDNLDGLGAIDYSAAIDCSEPFEIERTLNAPSVLKGLLCLAGSTLPTPVRRGRVVVSDEAGVVLFTGYLTTEPVAVYAGEASQGAVYRLAVSAVSDEWLLDKQSSGALVGSTVGGLSGSLVGTLAARLDGNALVTSGIAAGRALGVFEPATGASWSENAGAVADAAYSAYRALNGALSLSEATTVQHRFSDGDGTLAIAGLKTASVRELANDVTVTGAEEPSAYWTELFVGDGTTSVFDLAGEPDAPGAGKAVLIADPFSRALINQTVWVVTDPGSHFALTGAGFTFTGGNGLDGQTTLAAWDALELGGTVLLELGSVSLAAGSAGVLGGLYNGPTEQANCFAGFNIRQSGGETLAVPLVNGVEMGTPFNVLAGHLYTLRIHLNSPELLRVKQTFYALLDTTTGASVQQFGGGAAAAPVSLVFEARDLGEASNTPVTVLYDGAVSSSPAQANVVAVNSLSLSGSIGSFNLSRTGTGWVRSTSSTGMQWTRLVGTSTAGVDCSLTSSSTGRVTFFVGRVPAAGEIVQVSYRGRQRAVARVADPASLAAEAAGGAVGSARWLGHVVQPPARSQEDCENAAQAILSFATNRAAAVSGRYVAVNLTGTDIWPGDVLTLAANGSSLNAIVRRVTISQQGASPEVLTYQIAFANDWAEGLGIKLSETMEKDALLPETALDLVDGAAGSAPTMPVHVLENLQQMTVTGPGNGALNVDAGLVPPVGGGFEVRRRDGGFGVGTATSSSGDLVLRSPVRGFSIPVSALEERFFVRMYDASVPPLYSRFSAAISTHLPAS